MAIDLFAGIPVTDFAKSLAWYERLLGTPPSFFPNDIEAVWALGDHRYVYIVELPDHAGHARTLAFVEDLDARLTDLADQGFEPAREEQFEGGTRKITYQDPDGNEFAFGGAPS
ncbi:putative lactoylglutathione lyase [Kribbella amoyensis]|uniref:Putative lactoylglutathione lyase n=1 Tax=Kribbella amoyensis TaxID=996641 RepID=A0A561BSP8_9ACTN|nr:VOC family protein [Kribbella amoyensis]TWD81928.1 putative lactoylglutathione lyase [Kribbella amoyensis]